ncbi:MAG: single-stranded DNA-binding protein [Bacteroidetes bacterium]|nr:single-stranded DNA-binding protein [Bacteroidota bacterium]
MIDVNNTVGLTGRLGQNPELKKAGAKKDFSYLRLSLANNDSYKNKEGEWVDNTQWINLIVWGKTAEKMASRVSKGSEIHVSGKLKTSVYGEGTEKKYSTDVEVTDFFVIAPVEKSVEVELAKK